MPTKNTLIALMIFVTIFFALRAPQFILERTYGNECNGSIACMNAKARNPVNTVLSDLVFISRICIELGLIFLVMQIVYKVFSRK